MSTPVLEVPGRLSYSSVSTYAECGEKWRLTRGRGIKANSWYSTVGGKAVHTITELNDRRRLGADVEVPTFEAEFRREIAKEEGRGVLLKPSGKKQDTLSWHGGPNKKDIDWWLHYGPIVVDLWEQWRDEHPAWEILMLPGPDGTTVPAIEVEFYIQIGEEWVLGYIDRVFVETETNTVVIVDLKGGKLPESQLQLGDYGVGLMEQHGVQATLAAYWYAFQPRDTVKTTVEVPVFEDDGAIPPTPALYKSGPRKGLPKMTTQTTTTAAPLASRLSEPVDLALYNREYMLARYEMARAGIMAGVFLPNVTSLCRGCGVRKWCRAVGGERAVTMPAQELFISKKELTPRS